MDITSLILEQHHEQRRMFAWLDDVERSDCETLGKIWGQLHDLLEGHAEAEERHFYPELLKVGTGATDADSAEAETRDAIKDHNRLRDACAEANRHPVGSDQWFHAVRDARKENSDHMAEEERQALADFRCHANLQTRHELGLKFAAFWASHRKDVDFPDKDPEKYIDSGGELATADS